MKIIDNWGFGEEREIDPLDLLKLESSFGEDVFLAENSEANPKLQERVRETEDCCMEAIEPAE